MSILDPSKEKKKPWFVYIVQCQDNSLYTGTTTDITRRITEHNSGKGAKYTAAKKPVKLVYHEQVENRSAALIREAHIKSLSKKQKEEIIFKLFSDTVKDK